MDYQNETSLLIPEQYTKENFQSVHLQVVLYCNEQAAQPVGKNIIILMVVVPFSSQKVRRAHITSTGSITSLKQISEVQL